MASTSETVKAQRAWRAEGWRRPFGAIGERLKSETMATDHPDRQRRLAEALRANLRRRKGQARERAAAGDEPASPEGEAPPQN